MKKNKLLSTLITLLLLSIQLSHAATIVVNADHGLIVNDGICSITEAIFAANSDIPFNGCRRGVGADTIELTQDITLDMSYVDDRLYGLTGIPYIKSTITIKGQGHTLQRNPALNCNLDFNEDPGEFRLLLNLGSLTLENITLKNGCADNEFESDKSYGAGLMHDGDSLTITNSTFDQNQAKGSGGGLYSYASISEISNSTFSANLAVFEGSALFNNGQITLIKNSTFSGNSVTMGSGTIYNNFDITTIQNSTFSSNTAGNGGSAIHNDDFLDTIKNTLFHNNGIDECLNDGSSITGLNILSDNLQSGCPSAVTNLTTNSIAALSDNGGKTLTHALLPNSEAINAASNGTTRDQRDFAANGIRDIGAFEFEGLDPDILYIDGFE